LGLGIEGPYPQQRWFKKPEVQESRKVCYMNKVTYTIGVPCSYPWRVLTRHVWQLKFH